MSDDFEMPSDDVLRESARRENNFWEHAFPEWLKGFSNPDPMDERAFTLKIVPDVKYLVKDPKEPYRRSPSLEAMKGYEADPSKYPNAMPCTIRQPIRLNKVTWHLFPFRNTTPQTTFTHPERHHQLMHELDMAPGTYYTYHEEVSVLREGMVRRLLVGLEQHCHQSWSKLF